MKHLISSAAALSLCCVWEGRRYITPSYDDEQCCGQFLIRDLNQQLLTPIAVAGTAITTISPSALTSIQTFTSDHFYYKMERGEVIFNIVFPSVL